MNGRMARNNLGALLLIGVGALLLVFQVFGINFWNLLGGFWPLFIVLPGLAFLSVAYFGDQRTIGFAFPGTIITGTGLILTYQNFTNNWESWAYIWTLYPAFVGAALLFVGSRKHDAHDMRVGRNLIQWSVVAFVIGLVFFEFFIFGGNGALTRYLLPAALLGLGGYLLLFNRRDESIKTKREYLEPQPPAPRKMNPSNGVSDANINPNLRKQIDEALREDDLV